MSKTEAVAVNITQEVVAVELKNIQLHPDNGRDQKHLDLATLKSSIQAAGQLVPGLARRLEDGTIQLVCGSRRFKALTELKAPTMNLIIAKLNDYEATEAMVTENLQRKDMTLFEELKEIKKLVELGSATSLTPDSISARLGRPIVWVRRVLALTKLSKADLKRIEDTFDFSPELDLLARFAALEGDARKEAIDECRYSDNSKDAVERLNHNMTSLKTTLFDSNVCLKCTSNTATRPGLWEDGSSKDGICLNPKCFHSKQRSASIELAIKHANEKPDDVFYVAVNRGDSGADKFPKNVVILNDYAYGDKKKMVRAFCLETGKFKQVDGPEKEKKEVKSKAADKEAPIAQQIKAKQEALHGLRLKNVSEQIRAAIDEFKTAPPTFAGMTHMEVLNVALVFGIRGYSSFEKVIERLDSKLDEAKMQKLVWEGIRQRVAENVHCQAGTDAMDKEPRLKRICKLLGLNFDVLFELAKADKPDPKSLVSLLAQQGAEKKPAKKKA